MDLQVFKETLLEFLRDVTHVSTESETTFMEKGVTGLRLLGAEGYHVLTSTVLIAERKMGKDYQCWFSVRIFTDEHCYQISVVLHKDGTTWFGCGATTRKPRAGENWTRGNDLPDGDLDRSNWQAMKNAIIRYELKHMSQFIMSGRQRESDDDDETVKTESS